MRIVPRFQLGGDFTSLFTEYKAMPLRKESSTAPSKKAKNSDDDDDNKGKLTEKDLFNMIKDVDGLPNEMLDIVNSLMVTFQNNKLLGSDINDVETTYLLALYKIKVAKQNKATYDTAIANALKNGAMLEPAIALDGSLVAIDLNSKITNVNLETYLNNKDKYKILSVSDVAQLRAYNDDFKYKPGAFDIINNSMGFESFQEIIDKAIKQLGTDTYTNHLLLNKGDAEKGLELLKTLSENDLMIAKGSMSLKGLYETVVTDKSLKRQIDAALSYIISMMPTRAKTFAGWKLQTSDTNKALKNLVLTLLLSTDTEEHIFDIDYKGSKDKVANGSNKDGTSSSENPKEGFWKLVQMERGGTETSFNILKYNGGSMSVDGKFYGRIPDIDKDCSLTDFLTKSGAGYLLTNPDNITFGNVQLTENSLNNIAVNAGTGMYRVILPSINGKVWIEAAEVYANFMKELKRSGVKPNTQEWLNKVKELSKKPEYEILSHILESDGKLTKQNSHAFLVLDGIATSDTQGKDADGLVKPMEKIDTTYIKNVDDDKTVKLQLVKALSNKENGEYDVDNFDLYNVNDWFGGYTKFYKGSIYIPINDNPINAMNADNNDIKESTSKEWEQYEQEKEKRDNLQSTSAEMLLSK